MSSDIKEKNKSLFKRITISEDQLPDEKIFLAKALKSLEETVELSINPFQNTLQFVAEARFNSTDKDGYVYYLILYPCGNERISDFSVSGELSYLNFNKALNKSPISFIYNDGKDKYLCEIMLENPNK